MTLLLTILDKLTAIYRSPQWQGVIACTLLMLSITVAIYATDREPRA